MDFPQTDVTVRDAAGAILLQASVVPGEYLLGRSPQAELFFEAELVSREHARLTVTAAQVLIEDLGSANGTFIGNQAVTTPIVLQSGQRVQLGGATLEVTRIASESILEPVTITSPSSGFEDPTIPMEPTTPITPPSPAPILRVDSLPSGASVEEVVRRFLPLQTREAQILDVEKEIARGGMGAVLAARESATRRTVAMKVMLRGGGGADGLVRFIEEAQVTAQLEHPNIVPVYELSTDVHGQPFYTMKLVQGITLKKVLDLLREGMAETVAKYPLGTLLTIFQKICDALAFAHSKGVIHRDLKPANIMLGRYGEVLVMDWGLAKIIGRKSSSVAGAEDDHADMPITGVRHDDTGSLTMTGSVMGTPAYMSPEQARGEVETLDARSDIYALGVILFEVLHLRSAVTGRSARELVDKVQRGEIEWASNAKARPVPESLVAIVRQAMRLEVDARYASVKALQDDLTAYQNGFATSAERAGLGKQLVLLLKRHRAVATSIAAALVVLALVVTVAFSRVMGEKNRAEAALADLQRTAPTLIVEGRTLIDAQQFESALEKITFAVTIAPRNVEYHLLRAQLLQAMLRLDEAATEFQRVLALGPNESAQTNLALCTQLRAKYPDADSLDAPAIQRLYEQIAREGRTAQSVPLAARLGKSRDTLRAVLDNKIAEWRKLPGWDKRQEKDRIKQNSDGRFDLDLSEIPFTAAPALAGLPVSQLRLERSGVSDLRPLAGLSLTSFTANDCRITDLGPLRGMPIRNVVVHGNYRLRDLSPLQGMPLRVLTIGHTAVEDLGPLRNSPISNLGMDVCRLTNLNVLANLPLGTLIVRECSELTDISAVRNMPLREFQARGCSRLRDFSPLLECPRLEYLSVPEGVREVEVLRAHPRLWRIGLFGDGPDQWPPVEQFWEDYSPGHHANAESEKMCAQAIAAGAAVGANSSLDKVSAPGKNALWISLIGNWLKGVPDYHGLPVTWLSFHGTPRVDDLSPLVGLPLRGLSLDGMRNLSDLTPLAQCKQLRFLSVTYGSKVSDLSPLGGLPLGRLAISDSLVADLSPLRDMPLRYLSLWNSKVSNLAPLSGMKDLRELNLFQSRVVDLRPLRGLRIERLTLSNVAISDISPLAGMPLRELNLDRTAVRDLRPLLECPDLEEFTIPRTATNVEVLRKLPKLRRLSYDWDGNYRGPAQTVEEFWKEYDSQQGPEKK